MNIQTIVLSFAIDCIASLPLFAQNQPTVPVLEPDELIAFRFSNEQISFWLDAEDYIARQLRSGIDSYSPDFYKEATEQEKAWLDSIDSGDSPYNTDYRSRYWGSNWSYASALITPKSDSLAYDFNLLTYWHSPKASDGIGEKITLVFEPTENSKIKTVMFFPGNMRTPADWARHGRPAQIKLRLNGKDVAILRLKDVMACQAFGIPTTDSYEKNRDITVEFKILSAYPGSESEGIAISEINFEGTNIL